MESSIVTYILRDTWAEKLFLQAVTALVSDQRVSILDVKMDQVSSHTYILLELD